MRPFKHSNDAQRFGEQPNNSVLIATMALIMIVVAEDIFVPS